MLRYLRQLSCNHEYKFVPVNDGTGVYDYFECTKCGKITKYIDQRNYSNAYGYTIEDVKKIGDAMSKLAVDSAIKQRKQEADNVNHPNHYQGSNDIEVIDVIDGFAGELKGVAAFEWGNLVKYVLRFQNKNGVEDLKKARKNLDWLIEKLEE